MIKLFEEFNNEQEIIEICKEYNIENYTINSDGSIDVDGNVDLSYMRLVKIPLKFNKITGVFVCYRNQLTSLEGCPKEVGGGFYCYGNQLTSLEGCPKEVGGGFNCSDNRITDLQGIPSVINGSLNCAYNSLKTLKGISKIIDGDLDLGDNSIEVIDRSVIVTGDINISSTYMSHKIKRLTQHELRILFEHGVDYNIFDKDGSVNDSRLERMFKDFNI